MNRPEGPHLPGPPCPQSGWGLLCRSKRGPRDASLKPGLEQGMPALNLVWNSEDTEGQEQPWNVLGAEARWGKASVDS